MAEPAEDRALDDFCARQYPRLVRTLEVYVGDVAIAEELAQEALIRVCRRWAQVGRMAAPGAWVHRVSINLANSRFRRRAAERRALTRRGHENAVTDPADVVELVMLRQAVLRLPPRQREAVILRHVVDLSVDETAAAMDCSSQAVRSLAHRGMTGLRYDLVSPVHVPPPQEGNRVQ